jgi:hypothetical protein
MPCFQGFEVLTGYFPAVGGEKKIRKEWMTTAVRCPMGFFSGGNKLSNFWAFANWLFAAALAGSMAREGVHLAETAAAPSELFIPHKNPETRDKNSLMSIAGILDAFDVVDGIFPKRTIR